jgi:hypothetical protein
MPVFGGHGRSDNLLLNRDKEKRINLHSTIVNGK